VNTAPRRFPSTTNEDAIRPHEQAFQRWSSPMIPDAAPTERADTMAVHHPPTFKVYTPAEVRSIPFRKSMPAYEELRDQESEGLGASTLLKWTGIGIVAGLAVLTALIVVLSFGGDRAFASIQMRSALLGNKTAEPATPAAKPAPVAIAETKPATKLEVPATKPAAPAKVAPKPATKKR
jgi:hypothetical protein